MRFYLSILAGLLAFLLLLEGVLHILPVNSGVRVAAVSEADPISHYLPNQPYVYSHGWALTNHQRGTTNAQGFANSPDFAGQGGLLVVGDSYIEAFMLPYQHTLQGQLDTALHGNVLAAAASGNGVADTLHLVRHYAPVLKPKTIVIFIKPTDLDALLEQPKRGHSGFRLQGREVSLVLAPYTEMTSKRMLLQSAILRYGYYNLKFTEFIGNTLNHLSGVGNPGDFKGVVQEADNEKVLDYYFAQLKLAAPDSRLIMLIDGDREGIYSGQHSAKSQRIMQYIATLEREAVANKVELINMHPVFVSHWQARRERMDFLPMDGHWNPVGHRLAAGQVLQRLGQGVGQRVP